MRLLSGKGLTVGAISGNRPLLDVEARSLMRVVLPQDAPGERTVQEVLNDTPAVDVVDDPLGVYHEAVPYEALVLVGPRETAESLKVTLPRFFTPLSFRRLNFEIRHVPTNGKASLLFGDLLETRLGPQCGVVQVLHRGETLEASLPGAPSGTRARLMGGQGRAVVALGRGSASDGLPYVDIGPPRPAEAFVITPGRDGPLVQRRELHDPKPPKQVAPVLGRSLEETRVVHNADFELYEAAFPGADAVLRIVPDSAFARVITKPRKGVDLLEIVGVFFPLPGRAQDVEGLAVRFDANRRLLSHGLRSEDSRVLLVGRSERCMRRADGRQEQILRRGIVPGLGLRLQKARTVTDTAPANWSVLSVEDAGAMGWIPLRLAIAGVDDPNRVPCSPLSYARAGWIAPNDNSDVGAALYLDWLDHAVHIVVRDGDGGSVRVGLASWCDQHGDRMKGQLRVVHDRIVHERADGRTQTLRHRSQFRLGPLWVRLHMATPEDER